MKLQPNQQRLRDLLRETITLLCKNGLTYHQEFSVEGLIVITLDNDTIFHANINETIKAQNNTASGSSEEDRDDEGETSTAADAEKRKRRKRRKRSANAKGDEKQQKLEYSEDMSESSLPQNETFNVKHEPTDELDLIVVKEEPPIYSSHRNVQQQQQHSNSYTYGHSASILNSPQLQGTPQLSVYPGLSMSSQPLTMSGISAEGSPWTPGDQNLSQGSLSQSSSLSQQTRLKRRFSCHLCQKSYTDRRHLRSHLFSSHGYGEPLKCRDCGQIFKWRVSLTSHKPHCPVKQIDISMLDTINDGKGLTTSQVSNCLQDMEYPTGADLSVSSGSELDEPLICIECGEVFKRKSSLMAHKAQCSQHFTPLDRPNDESMSQAATSMSQATDGFVSNVNV